MSEEKPAEPEATPEMLSMVQGRYVVLNQLQDYLNHKITDAPDGTPSLRAGWVAAFDVLLNNIIDDKIATEREIQRIVKAMGAGAGKILKFQGPKSAPDEPPFDPGTSAV